ncbi:MAG: DoxX family protein [Corynebacterium sp.]|nr:DoxX family protein [Corynebacterium sp.]
MESDVKVAPAASEAPEATEPAADAAPAPKVETAEPKLADEAFELVDAPTTQFGVPASTPGPTPSAKEEAPEAKAPEVSASDDAILDTPMIPDDDAATTVIPTVSGDAPTTIFQDPMPPVEHPTAQIPVVPNNPAPAPNPQAYGDFAQGSVLPGAQPVQPEQPQGLSFETPQEVPPAPTNVTLPGSVPQQVAPPAPTIVEERRGTMDFGIFLLRLIVGALFTVHSLAVFFHFGGSTGINGLQQQFEFAHTTFMPMVLPCLELIAGVFLILGLASPVASALGIVAAATTTTVDYINHDWSSNEVIFSALLLGLVVALHFTGPGRWSFDFSRSWSKRPLASVWIFFVIGVIAAVALWVALVGVNPLAVTT